MENYTNTNTIPEQETTTEAPAKSKRRTSEETATRLNFINQLDNTLPNDWKHIGNTEYAISLNNGMVATLKLTIKPEGFTKEDAGKTVDEMNAEYLVRVEATTKATALRPEIKAIRERAEAEIAELKKVAGL